MENEHAAYFDLDFILATCFMDEDEKMAVKNVIQNKTVDSDEDGVEEVTVTEISVKTEVDVEAPFQSSKRERTDSEPSRKSSKRGRNENRSETCAVKKAKVETGSGESILISSNQSKAKPPDSKDRDTNLQNSHTRSRSVPCPALPCTEMFLSDDELKEHKRTAHSLLDLHECPQCEAKFDSIETLRSHIKKTFHSKKTEWHCTLCDQYFCRKDALRIHKGRKHNGQLPEYMSAEARKERKNKEREKKKVNEGTTPENIKEDAPHDVGPETPEDSDDSKMKMESYDCKQCSSKFSSIGNLKRHERKIHSDQWNLDTTSQFSCNECDMKYSSMAALSNHNKWKHGDLANATNTDEQEEPSVEPVVEEKSGLKCPTCEKSFTRKDNMNKHIKTKHLGGDHKNQLNYNTKDDLKLHTENSNYLPSEVTDSIGTETAAYWVAKVEELEKATKAHVNVTPMVSFDADAADKSKENIDIKTESKASASDSNLFAQPSLVKTDPDPLATGEVRGPPDYSRQDITKSKYFRMNSYAICDLSEYASGTEADFTDCFDLPQGWKYRYCGPADNPEKSTHFITPDKKVIKSRLGAIEYLRMTGSYRRKELWEYATCLHVPEKRFEKLF